jgi:hypothetical protein
MSEVNRLLARIQGEYLEMPGLSLTVWQAGRLWGFEHETCTRLLQSLVEEKFLTMTRSGAFVRRIEGSAPSIAAR